ncbi:GNAT family N-acetyltransferase [Solwaraspora sp. WMMD1047]|uniref:GNAT family N-acetyltransferase n=1 Tax=Solwaraspora sp. WMMD1047 TaxID=3016102 RepID=UPI0024159CAE|nr:GNAT family N-acetyltransferase [Solwaraspora sp. WMMD1047]MDG4827853.1 GNAT family N-acetyltransferase [Solwaraspora sp. WMMD1047]
MSLSAVDVPFGKIYLQDLSVNPDTGLLRRGYLEILVPSLPPGELEDLDGLADRVAANSTYAAVALHEDAPIGMVVADTFDEAPVLLLSYLAVRPGIRGGGVGAALLRHLLPSWRDRSDSEIVVAEIEDPRAHRPTEFGDPAARVRFYQRQGYRLLPVPFVQPRVAADQDRVRGMLLVVAPDERAGELVPARLLHAFLTEYFDSAEGVRADDDPELAALLAIVERGGRQLTLLPPDRYAEIPPLNVPAELLRRDYPATLAALGLLAVDDRAVPVLDEVWHRVLDRMARGESIPIPRLAVITDLLDALSDAGLFFVSDDPSDASVLGWWFAGDDDPWAGWWRRDPPQWTEWTPLTRLAGPTVRRLPPLPRVAVVLADVLGLTPAQAVAVTGQSEQEHHELVGVARAEVIALIDRALDEEGSDGQLPAL